MRLMIATGLLLIGCYDPKLGPHPFLCDTRGATCPDGYSCSASGVCTKGGEPAPSIDAPVIPHDGGAGDGGTPLGINCSRSANPFDSDLEPNDTPEQADR